MEENEAREEICRIGRRMYRREMVAANDGNISCRLAANRFLCTPSGISKGDLMPEKLCLVDGEGNVLAGAMPPTSEIRMHLHIYRRMAEVNAVAHAHPPHVTAFSVTGTPVPQGLLPEVEVLLGPVSTVPYATPGTNELSAALDSYLKRGINTLILDHHGAVVFDRDLSTTFGHLETLDAYCRILLLAKPLGEPRALTEEQFAHLMECKRRKGLDDPRFGET